MASLNRPAMYLLFLFLITSPVCLSKSINLKSATVIIGEEKGGNKEFKLGVLAPAKIDYSLAPMSLNSTLVALEYSIEKLRHELLPDYYFKLFYMDTDCDYKRYSMAAVVMQSDYKINAFFGPMCTTLLPWTTALSSHYNLNSMTVGSHSTADGENTTVRLMSPYAYYRKNTVLPEDLNCPDFFYTVNKTLHHMGWKLDLAAMYRNDHSQRKRDDLNLATLWSFVRVWKLSRADQGVETFQLGLSHEDFPNGTVKLAELTDQQIKFHTWSRIIVVGMSPDFFRQVVHRLFCVKSDKFNIKDYVLIYLDNNYVVDYDKDIPNQLWRDPTKPLDDPYNVCLKEKYRHVLIFRNEDLFAETPHKYEKLKTDFRAACDKSNFKNCQLPESASYLQYVAATHDGVRLLMQALNQTEENASGVGGSDRTGGGELFPFVKNKVFESDQFAARPVIKFNSAGERVSRMTLLCMENIETGNFSAYIIFNLDGSNTTIGKGPPWIGGVAPKNPPDCGYTNEFCRKPDTLKYLVTFVSIGVSLLLIIILVVGFLVYRKVKMEEELMKMVWKIKSDELDFSEMKTSDASAIGEGGSNETLTNSGGTIFMKNLQNHANNLLNNNSSAANHHNHSNTVPQKLSLVPAPTTRKTSSVFAVRRISHHQGPQGSSGGKDKDKDKDRGGQNSGSFAFENPNLPYPRPEPRYVFPRYRSYKVAARPLKDSIQFELNRKRLIELKNLKSLTHEHIVRFIGCAIDSPVKFIVYENCAKGSLYHFLRSPMKADLSFRFSLMLDIARGLNFLVQNGMFHGRLNAKTCVLDNRFVCKIGDHGLYSLRPLPLLDLSRPDMGSEDKYYVKYVYVAPEVLRRDALPNAQAMQHTEFDHLMQRADYYSFAIISHEILYQKQPFHITNSEYTHKQKLLEVIKGGKSPFRPMFDDRDFTDELASYERDAKEGMTARLNNARVVMEQCWTENPHERPDMNWVCGRLKENVPENIMENMLQRMDKYAKTMETLVEEKAKHVVLEKKRADDLLYSILPVAIANKLIRNEKVQSEWFDEATIYFSDIVGFTALSSSSSPEQVVDLLNHLYTLFDSIIDEFDVYKVETIGDAYMVVSGIPIRNGSTHSYNIAAMSLKLLEAVKNDFVIPHRPEERLKLRIGLHTGPACAGVVGVKMPRYCLFGDTVNTASRMESNGEPLKIHISAQTKESLSTFNEFLMEYRGEIEMKGKGVQKTYWLKGRKSQIVAKHPKLVGLMGGNEFGPGSRRSVCLPTSQTNATVDSNLDVSKDDLDKKHKSSTSSTPFHFDHSPLDDSVFDAQSPQKDSAKSTNSVARKSSGDAQVTKAHSNGVKSLFNYNKTKLRRQLSSEAPISKEDEELTATPNGCSPKIDGSNKVMMNGSIANMAQLSPGSNRSSQHNVSTEMSSSHC